MIKQRPDRIASAADASRHVGAIDETPRPIVTANVSNTEDSVVAANAPSTIGDHSRKRGAISLRAAGVMFSIEISMTLAKTEERQHRQNYNDQADEIDKTVHGFLRLSAQLLEQQSAETGKVPEVAGKRCNQILSFLTNGTFL